MRIVFMGTPDFSVPALNALVDAGHEVAAVVTQPDRPKGRGKDVQMTPVKLQALEYGIPVYQPEKVKDPAFVEILKELHPEAIVVIAFGQILSKAILDIPPYGCVNIHASLLPKYRGAAPIQWAVIDGEKETGVTTMMMDVGLDTGDMCVIERLPIAAHDTTASLHDKLAALGGRLIVEALEMAACGGLSRTPQPADGVTYAHKIEKAESLINWSESADVIARRLRAFNPFPGGATSLGGEAIKVWEAEAQQGSGAPGSVLSADARGVRVACGSGVLNMTLLQRAGGKRLAAGDFLRGFELPAGAQLGEGAGEV